ncbi:PA2778 family cysteine peptidase, partial [Porticoccus sp.]
MPFFLLLLLLTGCVATPQTDALLSGAVPVAVGARELSEVPFFSQQKYQCGPAALATLLADSGLDITPGELVPMVYVPERKGSFQVEMLAAARQHERIPYQIAPQLNAVIAEVSAGNPVLVLQNLGTGWYPRWHYAVVVGFDLARGEFILRSGDIERRMTTFKAFENTWRRSQFWGFTLLQPGELPETGEEKGYFLAVSSYAEHGAEDEVFKALQAGLRRWPDSRYLLMGVGNHYVLRQQLTEAADAYEKVIALDPDYAPAHNNLAWVLGEQGWVTKAKQHASQAIALGGPHLPQYQLTLEALNKLGVPDTDLSTNRE